MTLTPDLSIDPRWLPGSYIAVPRQTFDLVQVIEAVENFGLAAKEGRWLCCLRVVDAMTGRERRLTIEQAEASVLVRAA